MTGAKSWPWNYRLESHALVTSRAAPPAMVNDAENMFVEAISG
jgi:hypothetical protein